MPRPSQADIAALLRSLVEGGVDFIVVGGAAAVLHGAPVTTLDLDIVPRADDENLLRLHQTLSKLDAIVREPGDRRLRPTLQHLRASGQLNLTTSLGPLDSLRKLHDGRDFEDLLPATVNLTDGELTIRVIDLHTLIEIKSATGRAKDRLVVPILLALIDSEQ